MNIRFFGCGAAGNKAALELVNSNVIRPEQVHMVNSTIKDIPEAYKDNAIIFANKNSLGGCGKERNAGRTMTLEAMKNGSINLDAIMDPSDNIAVICASTEGGSGSASAPIIAKYINKIIKRPVLMALFFGFADDVRGLQNTIELSQELSEDYGVIAIDNKKFLDDCNGNPIQAERLANEYLVKVIAALNGSNIRESFQNIDQTDLFKITATPGFMDVGRINLSKVRSVEMFNSTVAAGLSMSKSIDIESKTSRRIGLIFNIRENMTDYMDFSGEAFKKIFGTPYELFKHIQYTDDAPYVEYIAAGMDLPLRSIKEIFQQYLSDTQSIKKERDNFFEEVGNMRGDPKDSSFNMVGDSTFNNPTEKEKNDFFSSFGINADQAPTTVIIEHKNKVLSSPSTTNSGSEY